MKKVIVYGADWCSSTQHALDHLEEMKVPFEYVDIESNPRAAAWVRGQNGGKEVKPTIDVGGEILSEPSDGELDKALR